MPSGNDGEMTVTEHLRELRRRLGIALLVFFLCMLGGIYLAPRLVAALLAIGTRLEYQFVYIAPEELLLVYLTADLALSLVIASPVIFYEIWAFVKPALHRHEHICVKLALVSGFLCAALGVIFALQVLIPFMLRFLIALGADSAIQGAISVKAYISLLLTLLIVFAIVFELPVLMVLLTQLQLLPLSLLRKARKYVIVGMFLLAALITPPDVLSQLMVAGPLLVLYELGLGLSGLFERQRAKRAERAKNI